MNSMKQTTRDCFQTLSICLGANSKREAEVKTVKNLMLQTLMLIVMVLTLALVTGCNDRNSGDNDPVTEEDTTTSDTDTTPDTSTPDSVLKGQFAAGTYVIDLGYSSGSQSGNTDGEGNFQYKSGEAVAFNAGEVTLGSALGKSLMTPFDLSSNDQIVMAIASLLQSLDTDTSDNVIRLSASKLAALNAQLAQSINLGTLAEEDVADALATLDAALMVVAEGDYVDPETALVVMMSDLTQFEYMARNISKTPDEISDKAGVDIMEAEVAARTASGEAIEDLGLIHPIVTSYWDAKDAHAAVSYDNGATWKRTNLSRHAGKTINIGSLTFEAAAKGPSMHVADNYVLVSWISTYCPGAPDFVVDGAIPADVENPAKAILANETDEALKYTEGDLTVVDLFKVMGSQGTVDYSATYPDVGVVPYHCVWSARGVLDVNGDFSTLMGVDTTGQFVWFKGQQMTSGVRDAKLDWPAGMTDFGFGMVWQEDPEGLMPGEGEGPGVGWSGAKTHHKTNIWYSYISWADFAVPDTELDSETQRPKALYTMSVPIPVSDNESCNIEAVPTNPDNAKLMCSTDAFCSATATVPTQKGDSTGTFCVVDYNGNPADYEANVDAVLDGDTAASRPNLHFAARLDVDGETVIGARALVMYEESKGLCELGNGCKDSTYYPYDIGKFVMYHHMEDFVDPLSVHKGDIISAPVQTATTDPFDDAATYLPEADDPDTTFDESALYENARRERFVVNADPTHDTKFVMIYKQGWYNQGERADIFMRRAVGGYDIENVEQDVCVSCVTPASVVAEDDGTTLTAKVESWTWTPANLDDESWTNPYDDARSLRAVLQGDRLLVGFAWTPNWQLATNADNNGNFKDHYDFYVRRSFDSGKSFTDINGIDEGPRNTSYLSNNKENVVEPRIATLGGSIINCESVDGYFQGGTCGIDDPALTELANFFVVTYCTAANVEREPVGGIPVHAPGLDCYYSWTQDNGETYIAPPKEIEVVDEYGQTVTIEVPDFQCLACSEQEEVEPEVVLSAGSSFADTIYSSDHEGVVAEMHGAWVVNGVEDPNSGSTMQTGSDAWYGLFELKEEEETTE